MATRDIYNCEELRVGMGMIEQKLLHWFCSLFLSSCCCLLWLTVNVSVLYIHGIISLVSLLPPQTLSYDRSVRLDILSSFHHVIQNLLNFCFCLVCQCTCASHFGSGLDRIKWSLAANSDGVIDLVRGLHTTKKPFTARRLHTPSSINLFSSYESRLTVIPHNWEGWHRCSYQKKRNMWHAVSPQPRSIRRWKAKSWESRGVSTAVAASRQSKPRQPPNRGLIILAADLLMENRRQVEKGWRVWGAGADENIVAHGLGHEIWKWQHDDWPVQ